MYGFCAMWYNVAMYQFSTNSVKRMAGVNPQLVAVFMEAIKWTPVDFGIPQDGGLRTADRQNQLFIADKSQCDGHEKVSKHQSGDALDFYAYVNGKASWDTGHLSMVAAVILSTASRMRREGKIDIKLYWGGQFGSSEFKGWDMPHFEVFRP